jgi:outer membrane biosynthesis protein TonB
VEVDERGRPTGRVELEPPTPSPSFNRELRGRMARLEFLPARRDGRPVVAWAEITFTFGGG